MDFEGPAEEGLEPPVLLIEELNLYFSWEQLGDLLRRGRSEAVCRLVD